MTRTLDVYLHQHLAGHLVQDQHGQMAFEYAESWLRKPHPHDRFKTYPRALPSNNREV